MRWFWIFSKIRFKHVRLIETTNFRSTFTNIFRFSHILFDHQKIFKKRTYVMFQKYFSKIAFLSKYCKFSYNMWIKWIENFMFEKIYSKNSRRRSTKLWTIEISLFETTLFEFRIYKHKSFSKKTWMKFIKNTFWIFHDIFFLKKKIDVKNKNSWIFSRKISKFKEKSNVTI